MISTPFFLPPPLLSILVRCPSHALLPNLFSFLAHFTSSIGLSPSSHFKLGCRYFRHLLWKPHALAWLPPLLTFLQKLFEFIFSASTSSLFDHIICQPPWGVHWPPTLVLLEIKLTMTASRFSSRCLSTIHCICKNSLGRFPKGQSVLNLSVRHLYPIPHQILLRLSLQPFTVTCSFHVAGRCPTVTPVRAILGLVHAPSGSGPSSRIPKLSIIPSACLRALMSLHFSKIQNSLPVLQGPRALCPSPS